MAQEPLEVIRAEQVTPDISILLHNAQPGENVEPLDDKDIQSMRSVNIQNLHTAELKCACGNPPKEVTEKANDALKTESVDVEKLLAEKEKQLLEEFEVRLKNEIDLLTDRFDFILRNEQVRTSYMLTAAHRERQEKVMALQTQLQCKNLAGLLYVMCSERRRSRLQKVQIVEEFTKYITNLHEVLSEAQDTILHLSLGYKTAARVDREWREKMTSVITEFQNFVYHFAGGTPESNQYFFDLPKLLQIEASIEDNPEEDPICNCDEEWQEEPPPYREKEWWEGLDEANRPFVVFGDMGDFNGEQRRRTLTCIKAKKTAPKKWKEYVFNHQTLLKSNCPNLKDIQKEYESHLPIPGILSCTKMRDDGGSKDGLDNGRTARSTSIDVGRGMGSLVRMMTQTGTVHSDTKATLLGARDSMEIVSTTKLKQKSRQSVEPGKVISLNVGCKKASYHEDASGGSGSITTVQETEKRTSDAKDDECSATGLGKNLTDSMEIIKNHVPEKDHKIIERICPMEECKRMHMGSFLQALPSYMQSSPYTHFEQTFEHYKTCSPEQLEMIKSRTEELKRRARTAGERFDERSVLNEWMPPVEGVGIQTSDTSIKVPPCRCRDPNVSPVSSTLRIFNVEDLIPVKQKLNEIHRQCFFDDEIEFDRFKVLGMQSASTLDTKTVQSDAPADFTRTRLQEIKGILKKHPSLCEIFQANARCS